VKITKRSVELNILIRERINLLNVFFENAAALQLLLYIIKN